MKSFKIIIFLLITLILGNTVHFKTNKSNGFVKNYISFAEALEQSSNESIPTNPKPRFTKVEAGANFSVALKSDGTVVAWGKNTARQCDVPKGLCDVIDIQAGFHHVVALKKNGTVVAWGSNNYGQCNVPRNLAGVKSIASNWNHSVALTHDGRVFAWGMNVYGQCNIPAGITDVKEVATMLLSTVILQNNGTLTVVGQQVNLPQSINVKEFSCGWFHALGLNEDGSVSNWEANSYINISIPDNLPVIKKLEGGWHHTLAITQEGKVVSWGANEYGQCNVPDDLEDVVSVSAGFTHSLALKSDGTIIGWGDNIFGESGPSVTSPYSKLDLVGMFKKGLVDVTWSVPLSEPYKFPILNCIDGDDTTLCYTERILDPLRHVDIRFSFDKPQKVTEVRTVIGQPSFSYLPNYWYLEAADNQFDLENKSGSYISITGYENGNGCWSRQYIPDGGITRKIWNFHIDRQSYYDPSAYVQDLELYTTEDIPTPSATDTVSATQTATPTITATATTTSTTITPSPTIATTPSATPTAASYTVPAPVYTPNPNVSNIVNTTAAASSTTSAVTPTPAIIEMSTPLPGADNKSKIGQPTAQSNTALMKPDLIITDIECYPENPKADEWVNLNVKVKNIGSVPIKVGEKIVVSFYANDSGKLICKSNEYVDGLPSGKAINLLSYKNDNGGFIAKEPIYKITAIIDYSNSIDEVDENNNISVRRFFWDLPSNHWARKEVIDLVSRSILSGKTTLYTFRPDDYITRAELVTALVKMLGKDDLDAEIPFKDVKKTDWFYQYVVYAYNKGLILGKSKDTFNPQDRISRQDMAVIFMRIIEKYNPDGTLKTGDSVSSKDKTAIDTDIYLSKFIDNKSISDYARNGVGTLVKYNLIRGKDDGKIDPLSYITRAETAILIYRYYNLGK